MTGYNVAREGSVFGMDVHARSVTVRGFDWATGEQRSRRFCGPEPAGEIAAWMGECFTAPHAAAYESGCTGFHLCRRLREAGVRCDVVATSSIPRSSDDRKRKTDRRDAGRLLSEMMNPASTLSTVWVPDEGTEAARELARARADAAREAARAKQRADALLLRHGMVWDQRTPSGRPKKAWGADFLAWARAADLGGDSQRALEFALLSVEEAGARVALLDGMVAESASTPRWAPYVDALALVKGVDVGTAFLAAAEFGDFSRFPNGRSVSSWLGLTPSESSSGEKVAHGRITKCGNAHLRRALVEGLSAISRFSPRPKAPRRGHEVPPEVAAKARDASTRLQERYRHLVVEAGMNANKAKVACASELARWLWAIGGMVQAGRAGRA